MFSSISSGFCCFACRLLEMCSKRSSSSAETNSLSFILALAKHTHTHTHTQWRWHKAHTYTYVHKHTLAHPHHNHTHTLLHTGTHRTRSTSRLDFIFDSHHLAPPGHPLPLHCVCVCAFKVFLCQHCLSFWRGGARGGGVGHTTCT